VDHVAGEEIQGLRGHRYTRRRQITRENLNEGSGGKRGKSTRSSAPGEYGKSRAGSKKTAKIAAQKQRFR